MANSSLTGICCTLLTTVEESAGHLQHDLIGRILPSRSVLNHPSAGTGS
jgi:hypothetical protein